MEPAAYEQMRRVEDSHWWYVAGREQIARLTDRCWPSLRCEKILDAGCGTGGTTAWLSRFGQVFGVDLHTLAVLGARERGLTVTRASVEALPFPNQTFELVVSLDVLYHAAVRDPEGCLAEMARVTASRGRLILRAPALKALAGEHDRFVHGIRRFTVNQVVEALGRTGWRTRWAGYVNFPLVIPGLIVRKLRFGSRTADLSLSAKAGRALLPVLRLESMLIGRVQIPLGTSVLVAAEKLADG